ncbi:MAG TPA: hypothetical protein EYP59_17170 [Thiotrichaceae bacterium]|nr:hypothetical protein [Thiotrichaceae bacterium]
MTISDSKKEATNKRITKNDLNQLAQSRYGEDVYCEHVRSGKRGWYLHLATEKTFLGVNASEAFESLQMQEQVTATPASDASTTVIPTESPVISEETVAAVTPAFVPVTPKKEVPVTEETVAAPEQSAPSEQAAITQEAEGTKVDEEAEQRAPISPEELLDILMAKFPKTFFIEPEKIRPLQKYIHKKIRKALNNEYSKGEISEALILYTQTLDYCEQLMKGGQRIDLHGNPCGEVSKEHQEDAKERMAGEKDMRFQKQMIPRIPRLPLPPPQLDELITGKMEVCLKIHELPADSKTNRNGWEEFVIETEKHTIKTMVRPKTWKKLQNAGKEYSHWIANIRGQMGPRTKGGFELLTPAIQIFETKSKEQKLEEESQAATEPSSITNSQE